ncbi:MAG: hypothetical protein GY889_06290 [Proteobacteria bacterium]|jgi:hypothetical protein|nr:hypothetical protein [Deltaproteobacteria bacterium]MCP4828463.1 hypothetical protein [Pseudomonadota bacterium]
MTLDLWFADVLPDREGTWFSLRQIYLHGAIEDYAGFDLIVKRDNPDVPTGVYPVVIDVSGVTYDCTAHVWNSSLGTKGLVVLNTDKENLEDAHLKFLDKSVAI